MDKSVRNAAAQQNRAPRVPLGGARAAARTSHSDETVLFWMRTDGSGRRITIALRTASRERNSIVQTFGRNHAGPRIHIGDNGGGNRLSSGGKPDPDAPGVAMGRVRLLLTEDHWLVRASLRSLIDDFPDAEVIAEASNGREALELVTQHRPDLVLMDISMPGLNGLEATRRIVKEFPQVRVIVLSMHTNESYVLQALRAGASGYVLKGSPPNELELAIASVARGEIFLSPAISKHVIDAYLNRTEVKTSSLEQLTPRQREILQLIAEGKSSKEIAQLLDASVKTIESHRASLMERLDIHDLAGLVRYAIRHGLVSPEE